MSLDAKHATAPDDRRASAPKEAHQEVLDLIVRRIVDAAHPLRIILFGSAARGALHQHSDVDVLVVMPDGTPPLRTAQELHQQMYDVPASVDIVVATPSILGRYQHSIGLIYREALRDGRELYAA